MRSCPFLRRTLLILCLAITVAAAADTPPEETTRSAAVQALQEYNVLVGTWRGIGQPKRGSQAGAWQERVESVWELKPKSTGIRWAISGSKQWESALLSYDEEDKTFTLTVTLADESTRIYRGKPIEKRLVLESASEDDPDVQRATLTLLNENRITLLLEKRPHQQSFFSRVAEIGYQREGTRLAAVGNSGPECVVTGGLGTIAVMHQGKTFYVCCTGCRDAFNDDPEGTLADFKKRKEAEKAARSEK
ncbi:hypothetical protein [Schlesneria sp. DSM 10557]|uniref:hypothetical protein n=1 Tax=Schlesneria sp. DSM 10557 TaxID=3044399 RepID=UPI00359F5872